MTAIAKTQTKAMARPLKVLVPLIKEDIEAGREAEQKAGMPYYQAAGEKLIEAKSQMRHGEFMPWVQRNIGVSIKQADIYMRYAEHLQKQIEPTGSFSSLSNFMQQTSNPNFNKPHTVRPQPWHEAIKEELDKDFLEEQRQKELTARQMRQLAEAERIKAEREERKLETDLALKLIDIGYKVLATKLHPDKGGTAEAFQRLGRVKKRLRNSISG